MTALNRRSFLAGIVGAIAAPAIVRASSLMPVKAFAVDPASIKSVWVGTDGSIRVYSRVLTAQEIKQLYDDPYAGLVQIPKKIEEFKVPSAYSGWEKSNGLYVVNQSGVTLPRSGPLAN